MLCVDTCSILDILHEPMRNDVRENDHSAALELVGIAEEHVHFQICVAELVCQEYDDAVESVQSKSENAIGQLCDLVLKMERFANLHNIDGVVDINHRQRYVKICRTIADRWICAGAKVSGSQTINERALARVLSGRTPSRQGKDSTRDCIILETYLDHVRTMRDNGFAGPIVFLSSNTEDFASLEKSKISEDLNDEFQSLKLEYAPNMAAAKYFLGF